MLLSIIIPAYNAAAFLPRTIESIKTQNFKDYEIIIVDDGSTDNTKKILEKYQVRVIEQNHQGAAAARNTGLKHAVGEYVFFMDSDDTLKKGALANMAVHAHYTDVVIGLYTMWKDDICLFEKDKNIKQEDLKGLSLEEARLFLAKTRLSGCPWRYFIKRSFLLDNEIYFPVNCLVEDVVWVTHVLTTATVFKINDEPFYNYCIRKNSVSTKKSFQFYEDSLNACDMIASLHKNATQGQLAISSVYYLMVLCGVLRDTSTFEPSQQAQVDQWLKNHRAQIQVALSHHSFLKYFKYAPIMIVKLIGKQLAAKQKRF